MKMHIDLPDEVDFAMQRLSDAGYFAYVVGGCVRDTLMHKAPNDWDITTSAKPNEILEVFADEKIAETGIAHGTVTLIKNHIPIEITTHRKEGKYSDFRRPDNVEFVGDIQEDLKRRDFTVNAMAYSPNGGLVDFFGGMSDVKNRILRSVGNPEIRFEEDALRIMRGLRFAAVLSFSIEEETAAAMKKKRELLKKIAAERIYEEFKKIITAPRPAYVLNKYFEVLEIILGGAENNDFRYINETKPELILRLAAFFCGIYKGENRTSAAKKTLDALKAENKVKRSVMQLIAAYEFPVPEDEYEIKKYLNKLGKEQFERLLLLKEGTDKITYKNIRLIYADITARKSCWRLKDLAVNGRDLSDAGIKGEKIGECLECLLDAVMRGETENKYEKLTAYLREEKKMDKL